MSDADSRRHARAKEIFLAAVERPADARAAFIDEECGDDAELRSEVGSLMSFHSDEPTAFDPLTSPPDGRFAPGATLAGRYRIVSLLGRGGMGEVYRAEDLALGEEVALKFLPLERDQDRAAVARFHREARVAREVTHPNVCRVHDVGEFEGVHFISMEYVDGETLSSLLRRIGRLPQDKCNELAHQLCAGLSAAHTRGVVHRDLKPGNVMIDGRGRVRITDFGIAAWRDAGPTGAGTPAYMAPELLDAAAADRGSTASDVYALGLVLYEMYTGHRAVDGRDMQDVVRQHREATPTSPSSFVPELDARVERVLIDCLEKDPALRPASSLAVSAALPGGDVLAQALAAGETPSPEMVAAAGIGGALTRRAVLATLGLLAVVTLTVAALLGGGVTADREGLEIDPAVLADRAAGLIRRVGLVDPPTDRGWGYFAEPPAALESDDPDADPVAYISAPWVWRFWYRQHSERLVPQDVLSSFPLVGRLTLEDPVSDEDGMADVQMDGRGRLVHLEFGWPLDPGDDGGSDDDEEADDPTILRGADARWAALHEAADLGNGKLWLVEPLAGHPDPLGEETLVWRGEAADGSVRYAYGDQISGGMVHFHVFPVLAEEMQEDVSEIERVDVWWLSGSFFRALLVALIALSGIAAWRHLELRLGDRRGAFRLAAVVFVAALGRWMLEAHHGVSAEALLQQLLIAMAAALFQAATLWVLYVALEPIVRRTNPHSVVAWARLLSGRVRDPLIGRDILTGAAGGATVALVVVLLACAVSLTPMTEHAPYVGTLQGDTLRGLRSWIAVALRCLLLALHVALGFHFVLHLIRAAVRRVVFATIALTALAAAAVWLFDEHVPAVTLPAAVLLVPLAVWTVHRRGLVTLVVATFVACLLLAYPVTLDMSAWYADGGLFAIGIVALVALFGARTARLRA